MKHVMLTLFVVLALVGWVPKAQGADSIYAGAICSGTTCTPQGGYVRDLGSGIYSIQSFAITQIRLKPQISFQVVTTQDFGYDFTTLMPQQFRKHISLVGLGGAGASASSTAVTRAFEGGGVGVIHTKLFDIVLGAKVINTAQAGTQTSPIVAVKFSLGN